MFYSIYLEGNEKCINIILKVHNWCECPDAAFVKLKNALCKILTQQAFGFYFSCFRSEARSMSIHCIQIINLELCNFDMDFVCVCLQITRYSCSVPHEQLIELPK